MVIEVERFISGYEAFSSSINPFYNILIKLALFTALIVIYAIFSFFLYKIIAKRNVFDFNFRQFNKAESKFWHAVINGIYYFFEYMILVPLIVAVWFCVFSILIWLMLKTLPLETIFLLAASLVVAARIIGYISEGVSDQFANLIPFIVLPGMILDPEIFNVPMVFTRFFQIPSMFANVLVFVAFIFAAEFIFRILYSIGTTVKWNDKKDKK
ncbi:MAG: hypothetical protein WC796_06440 [Candidatus Pacearchaeota archaeon]|jgi:hypothetical protein